MSDWPSYKEQNLISMTQWIYVLQIFSVFFGIFPIFIPYIINTMYKEKVQGTWLESHFKWQIQTFWMSMLFSGVIAFFVILLLFFGRSSMRIIPLPIMYLSPLFFFMLIICLVVIVVARTLKGWKLFINELDKY